MAQQQPHANRISADEVSMMSPVVHSMEPRGVSWPESTTAWPEPLAPQPWPETHLGDASSEDVPSDGHGGYGSSKNMTKGIVTDGSPPDAAKPLWKIWVYEILCMLFSLLIFALITIVLSLFHQETIPQWPLGITLNTFLALSTTICKAAYMFSVSAAIGQVQWTWFLRERPLYDFHVVDQASRGSWGSLRLLWRTRGRHVMALGAILIITSALISPITQLTVSYPMRVTATAGEAVTHANRVLDYNWKRLIREATSKSIAMASALDTWNFNQPLPPLKSATCSTGNCTFEPYQSLGICMKVANITSELSVQKFDNPNDTDAEPMSGIVVPDRALWKVSLPGGYDLVHQAPEALVTDILNGHDTFAFKANTSLLQTRIASMVLVYSTLFLDIPPDLPDDATRYEVTGKYLKHLGHEALEIMYHVCVKSYDTNVNLGRETTVVTEELSQPVAGNDDFFVDIQCDSLVHNHSFACDFHPDRWNQTLYLESLFSDTALMDDMFHGTQFSISYGTMELIAIYLKENLAGWRTAGFDFLKPQHLGSFFIKDLQELVLFRTDSMTHHTLRNERVLNAYRNVESTLSDMQVYRLTHESNRRLTIDRIRGASAHQWFPVANITGQAWKQEPFVKVSWGWIAFLAAELLIAVIFVGFVIVARGRARAAKVEFSDEASVAWIPRDIKDSSMSSLVVLSDECKAMSGIGLQPIDDLEKSAKKMQVRLQGNRLVPVGLDEEPRP